MNSIDYYLNRGFNRPWAEYFAAGRRRAVSVKVEDALHISVTFDDGVSKRFDCSPLIAPHTVFAPLADPVTFSRVYLDEDGSIAWNIDPSVDSRTTWSNKLDIDPDTVYVEGTSL